jgi:hypothetical protein
LKTSTAERFGVQGTSAGADAFNPAFNYYKGGWRDDGSNNYNGVKSGSTSIVIGRARFGRSTSSYSSVHPTQQVQP